MTTGESQPQDSGLQALAGISAYYRIVTDPALLQRELALGASPADSGALLRAAQMAGLKARIVMHLTKERLAALPAPTILKMRTGAYEVFGGRTPAGSYRLVDPLTRHDRALTLDAVFDACDGEAILLSRKFGGPGIDPQTFSLKWFLPSIWRYRRPLAHVLLASFFVQIFALVTPLFFQAVIDKVLSHRAYDTLFVLVGGLMIISLFDVVLQYLRSYALAHTTNRVDVELGRRLFFHLFRLPMR